MYSNTHPVNVLKFCPRCGSSHFPVTGNHSFKCDDCAFNYFVNSSAAVAVLLFNENGELLFTRRSIEPHFGKLDLPGGFIEPLETAEQAAHPRNSGRIGDFNPFTYLFLFVSQTNIFSPDLQYSLLIWLFWPKPKVYTR